MSRLDGTVAEPSIEVVGDGNDFLFSGITPFSGTKLGGAFGTGSGAVTFSIADAGIDITEFANNTLSRDFGETYPYDVEVWIRQGFLDWSRAGNVDFVQVADDGVAGSETSVAYARYFHGAPQREGNYGGVYFPSERATGGNAMIADALITRPEINFLDTVLHQIGHIIGLDQVFGQDSVMLPTVFAGDPGLGDGDRAAARTLYGNQDQAPIVYQLADQQDAVDALWATDLLIIRGNDRGNDIAATEAADTLSGGAGDDRLEGRGGDDAIDGGDGLDTAVYRGPADAYQIEGSAQGAVVRGPDGEDQLTGIERLAFDDRTIELTAPSLSPDEARTVAYLYEAGLNRDGAIDLPGLNFWIDRREEGLSEQALSRAFLESEEFEAAFGDAFDADSADFLTDLALVQQLYRNVLNREGETEGVAFWTGRVSQADFTRADLLLAFAKSAENVAGSPQVATLSEVAAGEWDFVG
ncbi:MAG: DUF4214 domain-containing protein [Pseudomonadota bacterium]